MITKHYQVVASPQWTWLTDFSDKLCVRGLELSLSDAVTVRYAGRPYIIPAFTEVFDTDDDYDTRIEVRLAPNEHDGGVVIDLTLLDDLHEPPPPPLEPVLGHSVLLAWGIIPAHGVEIELECIQQKEISHG